MATFIAILDDDPADRKQSERLLGRVRDERVKNGEVIYFDSYGSEEALLPYFTKYDLILIDVTRTTRDGMMVAVDLLRKGAEGNIVLYYDKIDYRAKYGDEDGISFIPKPLWQRDFSRLVDFAQKLHESKPPRVELRGETDTIYVAKDDIIYVTAQSYYCAAALTGDRSHHVNDKITSLYDNINSEDFIFVNQKCFINMNHVVSSGSNSFKMSDGAVIKFSLFDKRAITKAYARYAAKKASENS